MAQAIDGTVNGEGKDATAETLAGIHWDDILPNERSGDRSCLI